MALSVHDRVQALTAMEANAVELNAIAAWLSKAGAETEADMLEQAARSVLASCWLLERPLRPQPPPERWEAGTGQFVPYHQVPDQGR